MPPAHGDHPHVVLERFLELRSWSCCAELSRAFAAFSAGPKRAEAAYGTPPRAARWRRDHHEQRQQPRPDVSSSCGGDVVQHGAASAVRARGPLRVWRHGVRAETARCRSITAFGARRAPPTPAGPRRAPQPRHASPSARRRRRAAADAHHGHHRVELLVRGRRRRSRRRARARSRRRPPRARVVGGGGGDRGARVLGRNRRPSSILGERAGQAGAAFGAAEMARRASAEPSALR